MVFSTDNLLQIQVFAVGAVPRTLTGVGNGEYLFPPPLISFESVTPPISVPVSALFAVIERMFRWRYKS